MNKITCVTASELLQNIESNTEIKLYKGDYNISDIVLSYDKDVYYNDIDVGPYGDRELIIRNLSNVSLTGDEGTRIISKHEYANIITLINCNNISFKSIEFGHHPEMGGCTGGVLVFINCNNVVVDRCTMFGCGTVGITMIGCQNINIVSSMITKCNSELVYLEDSTDCIFENTKIWNNETRTLRILHCNNIVFKNCSIEDNEVNEWSDPEIPLFVIGNSSGRVILKSSKVDIPDEYLTNVSERLTICS